MKLCKNLISIILASTITITMVGCNRSKTTSDATPAETEITSDSTEVTTTNTETTTSNTVTTASSSSETTATTTATTQSKKKSALRVTDKSKDRTYQGITGSDSGKNIFYENPDSRSQELDVVGNDIRYTVVDYRYNEYETIYYKVSGRKGWISDFSCPLTQYIYLAMRMCSAYSENNAFATYDIDNDGTSEWIFQAGNNDTEYEFWVYSAKGDYAESIGTMPFGSLYVDKKGNLITKYEKLGHEVAYQVEYHNGALNWKRIYENSNLDEYTNPGEKVPTTTIGSIIDDSKYYSTPSTSVICENCFERYDSSEYDYCPYCFYNWEPDETDYNLFCDNCGYKGFTTGVGVEGIICPDCGHYIIDPDPHYIEETEYTTQEFDEPETEYTTQEFDEPETEHVPPETDPVTDTPVETDPIEPDPVYDDPVEEE